MKEFMIENSIGLYLAIAFLFIVASTESKRRNERVKMQYRHKEANK